MRYAFRLLAAWVVVSCSLPAGRAEACEIACSRASARDALAGYRFVFLGRVTEVRGGAFTVEPVRVWKGGWEGSHETFRLTTVGGCGYPLVKHAYYVFYADEEPQQIGLCRHEPLPLSEGAEEVAALDQERNLPPLRVADVALLPPVDLVCPPREVDAMIDRHIAEPEIVVVGKMAWADISHPAATTVATGEIEVERSLHGQVGGYIAVEFRSPNYFRPGPTDRGIWFVGSLLPNGRRALTQWYWSTDSEEHIRRRLKRREVLKNGCEDLK